MPALPPQRPRQPRQRRTIPGMTGIPGFGFIPWTPGGGTTAPAPAPTPGTYGYTPPGSYGYTPGTQPGSPYGYYSPSGMTPVYGYPAYGVPGASTLGYAPPAAPGYTGGGGGGMPPLYGYRYGMSGLNWDRYNATGNYGAYNRFNQPTGTSGYVRPGAGRPAGNAGNRGVGSLQRQAYLPSVTGRRYEAPNTSGWEPIIDRRPGGRRGGGQQATGTTSPPWMYNMTMWRPG